MSDKRRMGPKRQSAINEVHESYLKLIDEEDWQDLKKRYSSFYAIDYIETCCSEGYFIEAYCIAQQYIILSIEKAFPRFKEHLSNRKISEGYLLAFLDGIGYLGEGLHSNWQRLVDERNKKAHNLIDNLPEVEKLSKREKEEIVKFLTSCIEAADVFFVDTLKKQGIKFKRDDPRVIHLVDIAIRRVKKSLMRWPQLSKEKNRELVKKELKAMLRSGDCR